MFTLTIQTDSAAFHGDGSPFDAFTALFERVVGKLALGQREGTVQDINGNTIGHFEWRED